MPLSTKTLARASATHPWRTIAVWAAILVASFGLVATLLPGAMTTQQGFASNPEAKKGFQLAEDRLRGPMKDREAIVISSSSKTVDDPAYRAYVEKLYARVIGLGPNGDGPRYVESGTNFYLSSSPSLVSQDRRTTLIPLTLSGSLDEANENAGKIIEVVRAANGQDGFQAFIAGNASIGHEFQEVADKDLQGAERLGIPIALAILVLVFGALVAAFMPLVLALFAIVIALGLTAIVGIVFDFSFFVTNMISMMGLAVGIDYALFIVSRFREERARGLARIDAISTAGGTAGRAVLFSGMTVVLALIGMLIIPTTVFRSLAGGAIFVVVVAVAASLTLLPAVLSLLGDGVNRLRVPLIGRVQQAFTEEQPGGFWDVLARTVMRFPVVSILVAAAILIGAAVPYFDIRTGSAGVSTLPDSFQSKQGFLKLEEEFKGGQVYPAEVVIDGPIDSPQVQAAIERLNAAIARDAVFGPGRLEANDSGDLGLISYSMAADPNTRQAIDAVSRLRSSYVKEAFKGVQAKVYVTGQTAFNKDFFDLTDRYTPVVFVFVLGLSFVLLTLVFRSLVVPAKAILMNLLSVGAAYGLIVLVCQKGVGAALLGFQKVETIEAWLPLFLFSILFGLSMDYHVFLLSRIREHYDQTGNNTESVAFGLRSTGRLITGAALIMVVVFGGFARGEMVMFQQFGFGLGVAVLLDATVVRSVLVPASMRLLNRANWWLPSVLSWLPRLGIEGDATAREPAQGRSQYAPEPTSGG